MFKSAVLSKSFRKIFESFRTEFVIAEIKFGGGNHIMGTQGIAEIKAANWSDLINFKLEFFDCFCRLHVFAKRF